MRALWRRIDRELGLRGVLVTPYPHFSFLVAEHLDLGALGARLTRLAARTAPFTVSVRGLATFPQPWPVVYLRVVPNPRLRELHRKVWERTRRAVAGSLDYYRPERWVPHITLAHGEESRARPLSAGEVAAVMRRVPPALLKGTVRVDHLALIVTRRGRQLLGPRFVFAGPQRLLPRPRGPARARDRGLSRRKKRSGTSGGRPRPRTAGP